MKLGVLRVIAQKIPALLKALCKGGLARYGSVAKTIVAMNERIRHFGRLIMASLVSPGYVLSFFLLFSFCSCLASFLDPSSWCKSHPDAVFAFHANCSLVCAYLVQISCAQRRHPGDFEGSTMATWSGRVGLHGCWPDWPSVTRFRRPVFCIPAATSAPRREIFAWKARRIYQQRAAHWGRRRQWRGVGDQQRR